jgi:hypothetical protein
VNFCLKGVVTTVTVTVAAIFEKDAIVTAARNALMAAVKISIAKNACANAIAI